MSMPNVPDIKPEICIDVCDSLTMIISSIAEQEQALARLIDTETRKINCIINKNRCNPHSNDIFHANESVNNTLKNITQLEILLENKLQTAKSMLEYCKTKTKKSNPINNCCCNCYDDCMIICCGQCHRPNYCCQCGYYHN